MQFDEDLRCSIEKANLDITKIELLVSDDIKVKKINRGYCACCEKETIFVSKEHWLRDWYMCVRCGSVPRQRALMNILNKLKPNWRDLAIHESSPSGFLLGKFRDECATYSWSYYDEKGDSAEVFQESRCSNQNLECMTFPDDSFDVFITQDVFEHILHPLKAFSEIGRVLKKDGIHIFTVPLYPFIDSRKRVKVSNGKIEYVLPAQYHGNPISSDGALVTYDWGHDIVKYIESACDMKTTIYEFPHSEENHRLGLEADFLYVCVSSF